LGVMVFVRVFVVPEGIFRKALLLLVSLITVLSLVSERFRKVSL